MKTIILDTNFLMVPAQYKVDIFSEIERICGFSYELVVPDVVVKELEKIAAGQKGKAAARMALQLIKFKGIKIIYLKNKIRVKADNRF